VSKQTQAKRAAKQRKQQLRDVRRAASQRLDGAPGQLPESEPDLVQVLSAGARAHGAGDPGAAADCALAVVTNPAWTPAQVQQAVVLVVADGLLHSWRRGWQPVDLHQVTRRSLSREHVALLAHVHAEAMHRYAAATVDERWTDQLKDLGAVVYWPLDSNALAAWQQAEREEALLGRKGKGPADAIGAVTTALELLALLSRLDRITMLMPGPGQARPGGARQEPVDQKVLARVRALLAKAESTEFDEEAEALSAKAQELMTRYSIERIVVEAAGDHVDPATARRIWLDAPYAGAKALLVHAVAHANRCAAVWTEHLGFVTVVGDERDLAAVELLVTSLLVQATRAMLHAPQRDPSRARSFRQSFLAAYATRIGERLDTASDQVAGDVQRSTGADLVPVLAAHAKRVASAREEMFPNTTPRTVSVSNGHGYAAGRAAADLAVLPTGQQLGT
jgi:hypothetical protein